MQRHRLLFLESILNLHVIGFFSRAKVARFLRCFPFGSLPAAFSNWEWVQDEIGHIFVLDGSFERVD